MTEHITEIISALLEHTAVHDSNSPSISHHRWCDDLALLGQRDRFMRALGADPVAAALALEMFTRSGQPGLELAADMVGEELGDAGRETLEALAAGVGGRWRGIHLEATA